MRLRNTTKNGNTFPEATISQVWRKGVWVSGSGANEIRKDNCGAKMRRGDYGNTTSLGWGN